MVFIRGSLLRDLARFEIFHRIILSSCSRVRVRLFLLHLALATVCAVCPINDTHARQARSHHKHMRTTSCIIVERGHAQTPNTRITYNECACVVRRTDAGTTRERFFQARARESAMIDPHNGARVKRLYAVYAHAERNVCVCV